MIFCEIIIQSSSVFIPLKKAISKISGGGAAGVLLDLTASQRSSVAWVTSVCCQLAALPCLHNNTTWKWSAPFLLSFIVCSYWSFLSVCSAITINSNIMVYSQHKQRPEQTNCYVTWELPALSGWSTTAGWRVTNCEQLGKFSRKVGP